MFAAAENPNVAAVELTAGRAVIHVSSASDLSEIARCELVRVYAARVGGRRVDTFTDGSRFHAVTAVGSVAVDVWCAVQNTQAVA